MAKTFTFDSKTKNALFVHVLTMIIMAGKAVGLTIVLTSIIFEIATDFSYLSLFFPKEDPLLASFYFLLVIIGLSIIFGIMWSFGGNKEEIIKLYEKKDASIWIKLF